MTQESIVSILERWGYALRNWDATMRAALITHHREEEYADKGGSCKHARYPGILNSTLLELDNSCGVLYNDALDDVHDYAEALHRLDSREKMTVHELLNLGVYAYEPEGSSRAVIYRPDGQGSDFFLNEKVEAELRSRGIEEYQKFFRDVLGTNFVKDAPLAYLYKKEGWERLRYRLAKIHYSAPSEQLIVLPLSYLSSVDDYNNYLFTVDPAFCAPVLKNDSPEVASNLVVLAESLPFKEAVEAARLV